MSKPTGPSLLLCLVLGLVVLYPSVSYGGGAALTEIANPTVGRAGAGWAAVAEDASTVFMNPAGMSKLEGSQWMFGLQPLYINSEFGVEDGTTVDGGGGGNAGGVLPAGSLFYVYDPGEDWKFGVSLASIVGLGLDFDDDWAGRYYADQISLLTAGIGFSGSYQINDWLSVGAGAGPIYAELKQTAKVNNLLDRLPDGQIKLQDEAFSVAGNFGLLIEPIEGTRIGATYYIPVEFDFDDVAQLDGAGPLLTAALNRSGLAGSEVDLELTIPQMMMISLYQDITDEFTLMGNIGWQDWSEFGELGVSITSADTRDFKIDSDYRDTWHYALGARYELNPEWTLSGGLAYDTSAVSKENRVPAFAVDRQVRYSAGLQYDLNDSTTVGFAYTLIDLGDAEIDVNRGPLAGRVEGDFSKNYIHAWALNLIYRL